MTEAKIDTDEAKGRTKEAAGALTGNRRLKNEGRIDQARSAGKNVVDRVANSVSSAAGRVIGGNKRQK